MSILSATRDKFGAKLKEMRDASELVDKELQTRSNVAQSCLLSWKGGPVD